jgi:hypothetical protein
MLNFIKQNVGCLFDILASDPAWFSLLGISYVLSATIIICAIRGRFANKEKFLVVCVAIIPFVGPVFSYFIICELPSRGSSLSNRGPRGEYTRDFDNFRKIKEKNE